MISILLVDDDDIICQIVSAYLVAQGMDVTVAGTMEQAKRLFGKQRFRLVLTDVKLPDGSGFELARSLRCSDSECAIIFMTVLSAQADRVSGLEGDGDDYIVKPIDERELLARIRAVLRRYNRPVQTVLGGAVITLGDWTLDLLRRELATPKGDIVRLTRGEFDLFSALVQANGAVLDREYLIEVVTDADSTISVRMIDVMISRIRRKLAGSRAAPKILTHRNRGYSFVLPGS